MLHLATADAASSCRGAAALEGVAISGARIGLRITTAGVHRLAVVCSAPGGATKSELLLTVPLPVALSSVENHRLLDQSPARLPGMNQLGLQAPAASSVLEKHLMVAGDFLQQGRLSLFVVAASAARLERSMKLAAGESVFDRLEATVVSMDFIKSENRRDEFIHYYRYETRYPHAGAGVRVQF